MVATTKSNKNVIAQMISSVTIFKNSMRIHYNDSQTQFGSVNGQIDGVGGVCTSSQNDLDQSMDKYYFRVLRGKPQPEEHLFITPLEPNELLCLHCRKLRVPDCLIPPSAHRLRVSYPLLLTHGSRPIDLSITNT